MTDSHHPRDLPGPTSTMQAAHRTPELRRVPAAVPAGGTVAPLCGVPGAGGLAVPAQQLHKHPPAEQNCLGCALCSPHRPAPPWHRTQDQRVAPCTPGRSPTRSRVTVSPCAQLYPRCLASPVLGALAGLTWCSYGLWRDTAELWENRRDES